MTITLPDELRDELEAKARAAGFSDVGEYVQSVLVGELGLDAPLAPAVRGRLLALAEEGIRSPPIENPRQFLADLVRDVGAVETP